MQERKPNKYKNRKATAAKKYSRGTKMRLRNKKRFGRKTRFLLAIMVLLFLCLIGRLFYLQIYASDDLTRRALKQMTRSEQVRSERGIIYDRNLNRLVSNVSKSSISIDGQAIKNSQDSIKLKEKISKKLSKVLDMEKEKIDDAIGSGKVRVIARNVDRTKALEIEKMRLPGVVIDDFEARSYPHVSLASHVIGFTDREGKGLYGIERYYDEVLSGVAGKATVFKDTHNKIMPGVDGVSITPKEGLNAVLTVSEPVQRSMEEILISAKKENMAKRISAIVQETSSGEIIAMGTTGSFDLNNPRGPQNLEQRKTWDNLSDEQKQDIWYDNWRNFCVSDMYEPGSTFKTITAAAALEEAKTDPKKHYYCTGYIRDLKGITITCSSLPNPHGDIMMGKAYAESCNTTFVNIGRELGKENFYNYIKAFGFGDYTGIDLPAEEVGLVPKSVKDISDVRLATMSYGHGIAVTPIQMITAISAVVNGGNLMQPYTILEWRDSKGEVVKENKPKIKRQVISQETSNQMRDLMGLVVEEGTGTLGSVDGYKVGGKTGTADKVSENGGYEKGKYISSFVSVAPLQDPKYTVLVIVEEPEGDYYGATVAAPISSKIMEVALKEGKVPKTNSVKQKANKKVLVPDVENLLLEDAGKLLSDTGLKFNAPSGQISEMGIVTDQSPAAGTEVDSGTIVDLVLDPNDTNKRKIPKLLGKTEAEVEEILKKSGFSYVIEGNGNVVEQTPEGGEIVKDRKTIEIKLALPLSEKDKKEKEEKTENANRKENE